MKQKVDTQSTAPREAQGARRRDPATQAAHCRPTPCQRAVALRGSSAPLISLIQAAGVVASLMCYRCARG